MSILKVAKMGHPILLKVAKKIPPSKFSTPWLEKILMDMFETMVDYDGIGLAAPQVHLSWQICIIHKGALFPNEKKEKIKVKKNKETEENSKLDLEVIINPKIKILSKKTQTFNEGCLSVPGLRGMVDRPYHIEVTYQDFFGKTHKHKLKDFPATVFQHEVDHLFGKLYIHTMTPQNLTTLTFI
jgi:peptide deformylase